MASLPSAPSAAAPISQQMEQIDQQIVALLQDIDESFSNLHQTVATRLIPTVKRLNQNAAPTREFAKVRPHQSGCCQAYRTLSLSGVRMRPTGGGAELGGQRTVQEIAGR